MLTSDFDFPLPPHLIAQSPLPNRDDSRLFSLHRSSHTWTHERFKDILNRLNPSDLIVMNDSRVIPARLRARNPKSGGRFEVLLVEELAPLEWLCLLKPAKRAPLGSTVELLDRQGSPTSIHLRIVNILEDGSRTVRFEGISNVWPELDRLGEVPLPPYIEREGPPSAEDAERYQTVYARAPGSVAAPTAGLHLTPELLNAIKRKGVETTTITLHVGLGTFAPIKVENPDLHPMHTEKYSISPLAADAINRAKAEKRRIIAVGTTSVRVLESSSEANGGLVRAGEQRTSIFIRPPNSFQLVGGLITNFHLPRSTLIMLVSAFASPGNSDGREFLLSAYAEAVREGYRFFSYGDAMFLE